MLGVPYQISYLVPDFDTGINQVSSSFGIHKFFQFQDLEIEDPEVYGKPAPFGMSIGLAYLGDLQIEVLAPLRGDSIYTEFLKRNKYGGLHHLGFMAESVEELEQKANELTRKGLPKVQAARRGTMRFQYHQDKEGLTVIELILWNDRVKDLWKKIKNGDF